MRVLSHQPAVYILFIAAHIFPLARAKLKQQQKKREKNEKA